MPRSDYVRPVAAEDVDDLAKLAREIWHQHYPAIISLDQIEYMLAQRYAPSEVRAQLTNTDHGWWVGEDDGKLTAFAHAVLMPDHCKLDKLYVHPAHQHQGLGAALLKQVSNWARSSGRNRLVLQVNRHNALALKAYRKYGFRIIESRVCDIGGGYVMDDHFMELTLDQTISKSHGR
jgi:GNAT superfamily N-acetyltransferase